MECDCEFCKKARFIDAQIKEMIELGKLRPERDKFCKEMGEDEKKAYEMGSVFATVNRLIGRQMVGVPSEWTGRVAELVCKSLYEGITEEYEKMGMTVLVSEALPTEAYLVVNEETTKN